MTPMAAPSNRSIPQSPSLESPLQVLLDTRSPIRTTITTTVTIKVAIMHLVPIPALMVDFRPAPIGADLSIRTAG